jgi:transcriptional regulator GlxA family with amidase domain
MAPRRHFGAPRHVDTHPAAIIQTEGTTFRACVRSTRLVLAHSLVERTDLSIGSIAAATGFADHAHLTRCYRATFGTNPIRARSTPTLSTP